MIDVLYRGDYLEIPIVIEELISTDPDVYQPVDITGCKIFYTGKRFIDVPDEEADIQIEAEHTLPLQGKATLIFPTAKTDLLTPGPMEYDIQFTDVNERAKTIDRGITMVVADVTRRII